MAMRIKHMKTGLAAGAAALALVAGMVASAVASGGQPASAAAPNADAPLVAAFEQVSQNTQWTLSKTIPQTWVPAGENWEQEGFKYYGGRFYLSVFDKTHQDGHLVILDGDGKLIKDISFVHGSRIHPGGLDVYGDTAYVPLAENASYSSADILAINIKTFNVKTLFTVPYDHVGGVTYDPAKQLLVGQDWDSRVFYEWTLAGKQVAKWNNPTDYVGYQDCQYVVYDKMLCSGATIGSTKIGGFDLIDLGDAEHAILNGVPNPRAGNANEILADRVTQPLTKGTELTNYSAGGGPIQEWTAYVPDPGYGPAPSESIPSGTPVIDGQQDAVWSKSPVIHISSSSSPITADVRMLWDSKYLYYLANVSDSTPSMSATTTGKPGNAGIDGLDDSIDAWINWKNSSNASYRDPSADPAGAYCVTRNGVICSDYPAPVGTSDPSTVKSSVVSTASGYVAEVAIPWPASLGPQPIVGINWSINDDANDDQVRDSYITWDTLTQYWNTPVGMNSVALVK